MQRRRVLAATGIALSAPLAGCLGGATEGDPNGDDTDRTTTAITASEPAVAVGESATVTVSGTDVVGVQVWPDAGADGIAFGFDGATLSPHPAFTYQMYPPMWHWDAVSTVAIEVPVVADDDARAGTYTYEVRGFFGDSEAGPTDVEGADEESIDRWERSSERFAITITE